MRFIQTIASICSTHNLRTVISLIVVIFCFSSNAAHAQSCNPPVVTNTTPGNPTCAESNGTIEFTFQDTPNRTMIAFSTDGGASYPHISADDVGTYTISGLSAGTYDLWVRWGNEECPTDLSDLTLTDLACTYDLAIEKMLITGGPYEPGDTIEYTIVVTNQGISDASNITVTEDSDANLNFLGSNNGDEIDSISAPDGMELVWSDDFVGAAIDPTKWEVFTGAYGTPYRLQTYTNAPENVRVVNGALILEATLENGEWYSGMVHTNDVGGPNNPRWATGNLGWTYGRFEIRAKVPHATGMWPALWMRPIDYIYEYNGTDAWPLNGEIDILEYIGPDRNPATPNAPINELIANAHWQLNGNRQQQKGTFNLGGPAAAAAYVSEWHTYAVEWTPNRLEYFVDGQMYHFIENWTSDTGGIGPFDQNFDIILNLQVGGWPGDPLPSSAGSQMEIDWVRVFQDENVTDNGDETFTIGSIPAGMDETFTVFYEIDSSFAGTIITNQVQITGDDGDDIDSNPDTDYGVDEDGDGDGDDDDEASAALSIGTPCGLPDCLNITISRN